MSNARFPKQAYVRRLEALYGDLAEWRIYYRILEPLTADEHQVVRLNERESVLAEVQRQLVEVISTLNAVPRVS
jgi:capsule polysaccharide export protein KpsE/RkpR